MFCWCVLTFLSFFDFQFYGKSLLTLGITWIARFWLSAHMWYLLMAECIICSNGLWRNGARPQAHDKSRNRVHRWVASFRVRVRGSESFWAVLCASMFHKTMFNEASKSSPTNQQVFSEIRTWHHVAIRSHHPHIFAAGQRELKRYKFKNLSRCSNVHNLVQANHHVSFLNSRYIFSISQHEPLSPVKFSLRMPWPLALTPCIVRVFCWSYWCPCYCSEFLLLWIFSSRIFDFCWVALCFWLDAFCAPTDCEQIIRLHKHNKSTNRAPHSIIGCSFRVRVGNKPKWCCFCVDRYFSKTMFYLVSESERTSP